ncbi:hypothetical protein EYZ11_006158 [Aspergillus tanneri]|uniref:Uncharacterized protein n=1 Tax=Aspergillus tanneri TaxID=1220188 RepID=A0A4S3JGK4_9EURO|nr:hypothetical protein EYZ11_006158 [Aspergillus tanneri]
MRNIRPNTVLQLVYLLPMPDEVDGLRRYTISGTTVPKNLQNILILRSSAVLQMRSEETVETSFYLARQSINRLSFALSISPMEL